MPNLCKVPHLGYRPNQNTSAYSYYISTINILIRYKINAVVAEFYLVIRIFISIFIYFIKCLAVSQKVYLFFFSSHWPTLMVKFCEHMLIVSRLEDNLGIGQVLIICINLLKLQSVEQ